MYIRADPNEYCCIPGSCYMSHCSIRIAQAYTSAFVSVSGDHVLLQSWRATVVTFESVHGGETVSLC